jgi:hypothetical protein
LNPLDAVQFAIHAKGKVERGVSYVRGNALKARRFKSLAEENFFLSQWEENVADKRGGSKTSNIGQPSEQGNFAFAQNHPLIRDLKTYSDFISDLPPAQP